MATFNQAIVISVLESPAGTFTAEARRNGEEHVLASNTAAARNAAVSAVLTALGTTIYGDLTTLPVHIVDRADVQLSS